MTPTTPAQPSPSTSEATTADEVVPEEQPPDELWVPFRSWLEADPSRRVLLGAVALLAVQALVRGYVALGGWFLYDDLVFIGRASTMHWWSPSYLFESYNGHVMPGAFVWVAFLNHVGPLNYTVVALASLAMQAVVGYLVYRVLVTLFGRRPVVLVPLAVFLFTLITLPATTWWAAALNQLPGQAAAAGALLGQSLYHRCGRALYGYAGVASALVGLLFSEKVLLIMPAVFALTLLWFTPGPPVPRLRRCLRENWRIWTTYSVVAVPYAVWYVLAVPSPIEPTRDALIVLQTMGVNLVQAVLPALAGGPYGWEELGIGAIAQPPASIVVLSCIGTALGIGWTIVRRYRAVFGWGVVLVYWAVNVAILGTTRAAVVGPVIGREYRYATDVALVVVVFGALALMPLHGTFARGTPQLLLPRSAPATAASARLSPTVQSGLVALTIIGFVVAASLSTFAYDPHWRNEVSPRFVATTRNDLKRLHGRVTLEDTFLPGGAAPRPGVIGATTRLFEALPAGERPSFLTNGHSTAELSGLDDAGHIRLATVDGFRNRPGPTSGCGWTVSRGPTTIPLAATTIGWGWTVEIDYLASMEADMTVTAGSITTKVHVLPGVHRVFVKGSGAIGAVILGGLSYGTLCTDDVSVGFVKTVPGTSP